MPAPYIKSVLEDQSTRVTSSNGIIAGLVIEAKKGPINKPVLVTSQTNLLSRYTPGDKIEIGWDQAYYAGYYYLRDSNRLWVVRCAKDAKYGGIRVLKDGTTKPLEEGLVDPELHESEDNELFMIYGESQGLFNDNISIKIDKEATGNIENAFTIFVYYKKLLVETHLVSRVKDQKDGFGNNIYIEDYLENSSNYIRCIDNIVEDEKTIPESITTAANLRGGSDGTACTDVEKIAALKKLANMQEVSCNLIIDGGYTTEAYQRAIDEVCKSRKEECQGILSTPYSAETSNNRINALKTYRNSTLNLNSVNCSLYTPHQRVYDEFNDRYIHVAPSCFVAGAISKAAYSQGYQWPAAGFNRGVINTIEPSVIFEEGEVDELSENQINTIIKDSGYGNVIYDQLTLTPKACDTQEQSITLMINLGLRPALRTFLKPYLFELNDEQTRGNIVSKIETFVDSKIADRSIYDGYVVCNETNNSPQDIQDKKLNVWLYIKPTQPAKFITQKVIVTPYSVDFESLLSVQQ